MTTTYLVTGASGQLGRRVIELLVEKKAGTIVAATRTPEKLSDLKAKGVEVRLADFDKPETLAAAFKGIERAALISTDALDRPGRRTEQHRTAVAALQKAGVKHVVYTSLPNCVGSPVTIAKDHELTEAALKESSLDYTVLRNNCYAELLLGTVPAAVASGQLIDARPTGTVAWVTREDCAQAVAGALLQAKAGRQTLDVSGPEALSSDQLAAVVSEVTGKKVTHVAVTHAQVVEGMVKHGLPKPVADVYASFDLGTEHGDFKDVTSTVQTLSGKAPQSVKAFLQANRAALG